MRGRVATLLEVGTGFHPELSGRENIFVNGAILGMRRREIDAKFDEIVEFSGIERFIDTPVKRYSSGMFVRLAFAVAAHLEPEILLVDEVLAVGDAEFQRKCLGKMQEVSEHGRTVVFVSHNLSAVQRLCSRAYWIGNGHIAGEGQTASVVAAYMRASGLRQTGGEAVVGSDAHRDRHRRRSAANGGPRQRGRGAGQPARDRRAIRSSHALRGVRAARRRGRRTGYLRSRRDPRPDCAQRRSRWRPVRARPRSLRDRCLAGRSVPARGVPDRHRDAPARRSHPRPGRGGALVLGAQHHPGRLLSLSVGRGSRVGPPRVAVVRVSRDRRARRTSSVLS